jgi:hypothetical protein
MLGTEMLPSCADPDAKAVILFAQPGPVSDPNRLEITPLVRPTCVVREFSAMQGEEP